MNIFVMVDMEGISGIVLSDQVSKTSVNYENARKFLTWEVNACVQGCLDGGATRIVVRDAHASGFNFLWDALDSRASYVQGQSGRERMPGIASFDGVILLGYHAMAGTPGGILEHTMSSKAWQHFWLNGRRSGEIAIDAAIAGDHGVPTLMVSGDDHACREARRFIPGVTTIEVKKGLSCEGGILLPKEKAHALIRQGAAKAVQQTRKVQPFKVKHPVVMRLELVSRGRVPIESPHVRAVDGRTYEVRAATVEEALGLL